MDTLTALMTRTSQGALTEPAPSADVLNHAFQAALRAPDHRLLRPWRYLVIDGEARLRGDILQVWDKLNKALTAANIKVSDRNQSLGLYFVELSKDGKNMLYQLKLIRTSNDNVISLQKDDETLVESELSQQTFERLLNHWPS